MNRGGSQRRHSGEGGAVTAAWRALARPRVSASHVLSWRVEAGSTWLSKPQPGEWRSA